MPSVTVSEIVPDRVWVSSDDFDFLDFVSETVDETVTVAVRDGSVDLEGVCVTGVSEMVEVAVSFVVSVRVRVSVKLIEMVILERVRVRESLPEIDNVRSSEGLREYVLELRRSDGVRNLVFDFVSVCVELSSCDFDCVEDLETVSLDFETVIIWDRVGGFDGLGVSIDSDIVVETDRVWVPSELHVRRVGLGVVESLEDNDNEGLVDRNTELECDADRLCG